MSRKAPALADFRRIVIKVGSSLLVDSGAGRSRAQWLAALVEDIAKLHKDKRDILVVSSGAIALGRAVLKLPHGPLKLEDSQAAAAVGQIALARIWAESLGQHGITAGTNSRHARRHRRTPALSQCALDHRQIAGMEIRAGDQRERHRRDQRDPLWRQRSPGRARRHHDERGLLVLLSDIDGLVRRAARNQERAKLIPLVERITPGDRGDGRRVGLGIVARRHDDQDRGRQDRDLRRHAYGDRVGQSRSPPCRRLRMAAAPGS